MSCRKNNWPLDHSLTYTAVSRYAKADEVEEKPDQVKQLSFKGHKRVLKN